MTVKNAHILLDGEKVGGDPISGDVVIYATNNDKIKIVHVDDIINLKGIAVKAMAVTIITEGGLIQIRGKPFYEFKTSFKYIKLTKEELRNYKDHENKLYVSINGTYANVHGIDLLAKCDGTIVETTHPLLKDINDYYKRTLVSSGGKSLRQIKKSRKNKLKSKKSRRRIIKI
jgi:hypothetical protein